MPTAETRRLDKRSSYTGASGECQCTRPQEATAPEKFPFSPMSGIFYGPAEQHDSSLAMLETMRGEKGGKITGVGDEERNSAHCRMFQHILQQRGPQSLSLMIGMNENVPQRPPKDKVGEKATKSHHFPFEMDGKTHAAALEHSSDLIERAASPPPREKIEIVYAFRIHGQLAVIKKISLRNNARYVRHGQTCIHRFRFRTAPLRNRRCQATCRHRYGGEIGRAHV